MVANRSGHIRWACALLVAALLLLAGPALALGLGQIQVKSRPGEPLLAEIPVVANDPSELRDLQVRFASPETFRRVGLQPPDVAGTGLQLSMAVDANGRPVIRVTSSVPLEQPVLSFLVEADWGSGRLVREYTAVLDDPTAIAAPAQQVQSPAVAEPNTIPREPAPLPDAAVAEAEPLPPGETPEAAAEPPRPAPAPAPAPVPVAAQPASAPEAGVDYTVRTGDTLSEISSRMQRAGHSLDQAMLALLRSNPEAFIGGNINRLRAGAVLRMPPAGELTRYSAGEAATIVRQQVAEWRATHARAQPRPQLATAAATTGSAADPGAGAGAGTGTGTDNNEARLEIVPPSAEGEAGSGSGIQAGGEGEMLRQAQQTEAIAARDAEIGELRARVAELEKIQRQQEALIEMKDSALAAATDDLAARQSQQEQGGGGGWWIGAGLVLVLLAIGGWWLLRKRATPRPRLFGEPPPRAGAR